MPYYLSIMTGHMQHPAFSYETCAEALEEVEAALGKNLFAKNAGGESNIAIQLGAGTVIKLISAERAKEEAELKKAMQRNPLLAVRDSDAPWKLVVQIGNMQLPPLDVTSKEAADRMVSEAIETGIFRHVIEPEHDYLFVQTGPGTVFMGIPNEEYVRQRRAAIEGAMRAAAQQGPQTPGPRIIMPGRN